MCIRYCITTVRIIHKYSTCDEKSYINIKYNISKAYISMKWLKYVKIALWKKEKKNIITFLH